MHDIFGAEGVILGTEGLIFGETETEIVWTEQMLTDLASRPE